MFKVPTRITTQSRQRMTVIQQKQGAHCFWKNFTSKFYATIFCTCLCFFGFSKNKGYIVFAELRTYGRGCFANYKTKHIETQRIHKKKLKYKPFFAAIDSS